ncbi:MAG: DUF4124 domain-containing protein [Candidatus Thiodiazotropha sp. (ex Ctena orbiculata)]|uniref:DUF4124 domain-containing protein n=1 Tax=Candidatus Thiodiazotropha taylori TaxID=2792791 RepID=A0A944QTZ0_9GAMM|nr:DUF4124 domain-containing protein [Candidatus Thiodiazotropha taylori]PUB88796.1 MAG: hypothetical protein DBP00_04635 [gamma proteobacterium symbiont of Ctena orbiculata]MBT2989582.1 DUF4124 domain-containing protein [Candidatus Thiodiazotropha taylori]MBT2997163.1 DUF4124 domain-containing protein [Candidatus Thiodiazotropha taylori]MBT3001316.1 DUF4124 domain-containing protein [Candidatus Thiodiazotropha taylori]
MDIRTILLAACIFLPTWLQAGDVYRTVDAEGNVTYTDSPPAVDASAEKIEIHPGPSEASRLDTVRRNAAIRKAVEEAQAERLEKEAAHDARLSQARKELEEAEENLKKSKEIGDDDRQYFTGGRSRIRPEYFDRLKEAEGKVEAARKKYKEIRGY